MARVKRHVRSNLCLGDHPKVQEEIQIHTKWEKYMDKYFFFNSNNNYLQCFIGEKILKQSSSFSSTREINDSSSSSSSSSEESATEDFDLEVRNCSITLKYSSSVLALTRRDWASISG